MATKRCQAILSAAHHGPSALPTTSCTHALELAVLLLDLEPGDEVLIPSFAFASTANAFVCGEHLLCGYPNVEPLLAKRYRAPSTTPIRIWSGIDGSHSCPLPETTGHKSCSFFGRDDRRSFD
ncbi:MAG: DegT/DnrJ/EryC1/StrS family aminotransferase [Gemmatimonadaceae bacterium]